MEFITEGLTAFFTSLLLLNILCSPLRSFPTLFLLFTPSLALSKTSDKSLFPANCHQPHNLGWPHCSLIAMQKRTKQISWPPSKETLISDIRIGTKSWALAHRCQMRCETWDGENMWGCFIATHWAPLQPTPGSRRQVCVCVCVCVCWVPLALKDSVITLKGCYYVQNRH